MNNIVVLLLCILALCAFSNADHMDDPWVQRLLKMPAVQAKIAADPSWMTEFSLWINNEWDDLVLTKEEPEAPFRLVKAYYRWVYSRETTLLTATLNTQEAAKPDGCRYSRKNSFFSDKQSADDSGLRQEEKITTPCASCPTAKRAAGTNCGGGGTSYTLPNIGNCQMRVRNQGRCGSCWAHATAQMLTIGFCVRGLGNYNQSDYHMFASTQNLMDCVTSAINPLPPYDSNNGCSGGWPWNALEYVAGRASGRGIRGSSVAAGLMNEANYPFEISGDPLFGKAVVRGSGQCNFIPALGSQFYWAPGAGRDPSATASIQFGRGRYSECLVGSYMYNGYGPMAVSMYTSAPLGSLSNQTGVFRNLDICPTHRAPNHVVVLLGWGQAPEGTNYWLIQNSWGYNWFLQGRGWFFRNATSTITPGFSYNGINYPHGNATCSLFSMSYWMSSPSTAADSSYTPTCRVV